MEEKFVCPICGNSDQTKIGIRNGQPYCRLCIGFRGEEANKKHIYPKKAPYHLNYELSDEQKILSNRLIENYKHGINSLIHAVCGSGKTEIVLQIIAYAIECGERVGFAVPRRDVAIELFARFKSIFTNNNLVLVYGGHHERLEGDLIVLTTHQLFRYQAYFDLLIIDEIDAFPFKDNEVLQSMFYRSVKGHFVMMSATPDENIIEAFHEKNHAIMELFSRFHKYPLPVPEIKKVPKVLFFMTLSKYLSFFLKQGKQVFIFTPTIEECEEAFSLLKVIFKPGDYVHSKREKRNEIIQTFREGKTRYLVTTAVLERGVTIKDLQVIILHANHRIYDQYSLVQISGRVGRKKDAPEGRVIYIADTITTSMVQSIDEIERANKNLQALF